MGTPAPAAEGPWRDQFGPARALPLYRAASTRALETIAIQGFQIPGITLMERAGGAFAAFRRRWPRRARLAVVCGPGNNGGDGFVVARLAALAGWRVTVFCLDPDTLAQGDAARARGSLDRADLQPLPAARLDPGAFDAVVDAVFGTGLARPLTGAAADAVHRINAVAGPRLALDIPSGLHADTGRTLGACVRATLTVTFITGKPGLHTARAAEHVGELVCAGLDLPFDPAAQRPPDGWRLAFQDLRPMLGPRPRSGHKGHFGRAVVVGGDHGFAGAVRMAGEAAARVGAGLTSVATRAGHLCAVLAGRPELMVREVLGGSELEPLLADVDALAVGPGLGTGEWGAGLLARALQVEAPLVLDADALNLIGADDGLRQEFRRRRAPGLITPHPGEAARLLSCAVHEIECDRLAAAAALCEGLGAAVLLKGAGTVVQVPKQAPVICVGGHPAMASGGMGDVLTGVLCGLIAQGLPLPAAAVRGALLHARAAERARAAQGLERGLLAADLMAQLPPLASRL